MVEMIKNKDNIKAELLNSVYSDGSKFFVSNPTPKKGEIIKIALQLIDTPFVRAVFLQAKYNGVSIPKPMARAVQNDGLARFEIAIQVFEKEFDYFFVIATDDGVYYYNQLGVVGYIPDEGRDFRILVDYDAPEWVKGAVFYQIFPERFCNGRPEISVKDGEYTFDGNKTIAVKDWNEPPKEFMETHCLDFYGGDLWGVIDKIPYLKKLGVTALYLNPIFFAATVHKYDCLDYFHVDPHFGGDEALAALTHALHENGLKIILDVSINHTGTANKWFNKEGAFFPKSVGAFNNPAAPEREYYYFGADNSYKAWFDVPTLPTLNYQSEALRKKIYRDEDSVVQKWLKAPYNIDGWRFDVADVMARNDEVQLHHVVWPEIRRSIKEENKNAYILAEDWSDCSEFLNGDEWDSQMNYYNCTFPIRQFYGQMEFHVMAQGLSDWAKPLKAEDFVSWVRGFQSRLPYQITLEQFNLLDSHDTPRFHNDKRITPPMVRGALIMLFTLPGATNIYYGDEAGIDGRVSTTEGCRYPMPWGKDIEGTSEYALYHALILLKSTHDAFRDGGFRFLYGREGVVSWARWTPSELFITVASNSSEEQKVSLDLRPFGNKYLSTIPKDCFLSSDIGDAVNEGGILTLKVKPFGSFLLSL